LIVSPPPAHSKPKTAAWFETAADWPPSPGSGRSGSDPTPASLSEPGRPDVVVILSASPSWLPVSVLSACPAAGRETSLAAVLLARSTPPTIAPGSAGNTHPGLHSRSLVPDRSPSPDSLPASYRLPANRSCAPAPSAAELPASHDRPPSI